MTTATSYGPPWREVTQPNRQPTRVWSTVSLGDHAWSVGSGEKPIRNVERTKLVRVCHQVEGGDALRGDREGEGAGRATVLAGHDAELGVEHLEGVRRVRGGLGRDAEQQARHLVPAAHHPERGRGHPAAVTDDGHVGSEHREQPARVGRGGGGQELPYDLVPLGTVHRVARPPILNVPSRPGYQLPGGRLVPTQGGGNLGVRQLEN